MAKGCRLWRSEKCSCLLSIAKGDCTICIVRQFSYLCNSSSGRVEIGRQARLRIWCLARMGSSPFARTTKERGHKGGLFLLLSSKFRSGSNLPLRGLRSLCSLRCSKQAFTVREGHSVHENPLFLHGRRFQRNSVLKIGFYGTEAIFGVRKGLLWYGRDIRCGAGGRKSTTGAQQSLGHKRRGHNI